MSYCLWVRQRPESVIVILPCCIPETQIDIMPIHLLKQMVKYFDEVHVTRLEGFGALKSSRLEAFRTLKPYCKIGGFKGSKILQFGGF